MNTEWVFNPNTKSMFLNGITLLLLVIIDSSLRYYVWPVQFFQFQVQTHEQLFIILRLQTTHHESKNALILF